MLQNAVLDGVLKTNFHTDRTLLLPATQVRKCPVNPFLGAIPYVSLYMDGWVVDILSSLALPLLENTVQRR